MREATPQLFGRTVRRVHCLGAGGTGLGPLSIYLSGLGFEVTGEDDALTPAMRRALERGGVTIAPLPQDCELVVHSSAIRADHPVRMEALNRGLPLVRRGELLAEVVKGRRLIAVCGAHGKTTTTAMLVWALRQSGHRVGFVLGGLFQGDRLPPADVGEADWIVAEIDESDGTIDGFCPEITLATHLDWDHPDRYPDRASLEATYEALFARTRGTVLLAAACPSSPRLVAAGGFRTYGFGGTFSLELEASGTGSLQRLTLGGAFSARSLELRAWGGFNALNATAALAAAQTAGLKVDDRVLSTFPGVRRRQAVLSERGGVTVVEDYAHHPAEIAALLDGIRGRLAPGGRLHVVFQPHRYSRTARFLNDFAEALARADRVHLLEVYSAGEAPCPGGLSSDLAGACRALREQGKLTVLRGSAEWGTDLEMEVKSGDWVAFVGAGDVDQLGREWVSAHEAHWWNAWMADLKSAVTPECHLVREEPLGPRTTMRAGGKARLYAEPAGKDDLATLLRAARASGVRWYLLGRGSNILVPDEGVDGLVIAFTHESWSQFRSEPDGRVWVGAGLRLRQLCGLAAKAGLAGFEFLEGIPASVGGALRMNAGAMGGWMFDRVDSVSVMTPDGEVCTLRREEMHYDYRHCADLEHSVALGAWLMPSDAIPSAQVQRQMEEYRRKRHETQPREPSAGCMFKNPPGDSAGRIIDACGLKGAREGEAEVSDVHANFIVNKGNATATEILNLVRRVRRVVRAKTGIVLEPEVQLFGGSWNDFL